MTVQKYQAQTVDNKTVEFPIVSDHVGAIGGVVFTPGLCEFLITYSQNAGHRNRTLSEERANSFGADMLNNRWSHNGETMIFGRNGVLLDGHTRAWASFISGASFTSAVVYGVENIENDDALHTIDVGRVRTAGAILGILGEEHPQALGYGLSWAMGYAYRVIDLTKDHPRTRASMREQQAFLTRHARVRMSVMMTADVRNKGLLSPGALVAAHYVASCVDTGKADEFFFLLGKGDVKPGNPVFALRSMLLNRKELRLRNTECFATIIEAFLDWTSDKRVQKYEQPDKVIYVDGFRYESRARPPKITNPQGRVDRALVELNQPSRGKRAREALERRRATAGEWT